MRHLTLILLMALIATGCSTGYQKSGFSGGFSETQLDENVFKVTYKGNGFTSSEEASDFTLLRSAELALKNGFQYFSIIDANSEIENSTHTTSPTTSTTTGNVNSYGSFNATTTNYGGQTYSVSKPSSSNTIVCFKEKPSEVFTYDANFIYESITEKYGIKPTDS